MTEILILTISTIRSLAVAERERQGLTQAHLASLLGFSQKWVSDFERGKSDPPASMMLRLLRVLKIDLSARSGDAAAVQNKPAGIEDEEITFENGF